MPPRKRLTIKERKALNTYIRTGNVMETGKALGDYKNDNTTMSMGAKLIHRGNIQEHLNAVLNSVGLSTEQIASNLKQLTRAKKITPIKIRRVIDEELVTVIEPFEQPDNDIRLRANKLAGMYHGFEDKLDTSPSTVRINNLNIDMSKLSTEELNEIIAQGNEVMAEFSVEDS